MAAAWVKVARVASALVNGATIAWARVALYKVVVSVADLAVVKVVVIILRVVEF